MPDPVRVRPATLRARVGGLRRALSVYTDAFRDAQRHIKHGGVYEDRVLDSMTTRQVERQLTKDYHRIEKGLALPAPKAPFGERPESRLRSLLAREQAGEAPATYATTALSALRRWNEAGVIDDAIAPHRTQLLTDAPLDGSFSAIVRGRRSIRNFLPQAPDSTLLESALELACNTPSVCNRQAWFAHYYTGAAATSLLELQNGNAGFRHTIPALLVVTADASQYSGVGERNQRWIDGGLFAMALALSIESVGLASCFLNWSVSSKRSNELRIEGGIDKSEDIVTFLAVGYAASDLRVARSPRRPIADVFKPHGNES